MTMPAHIHHRVLFSDLSGCRCPELITIEGSEAQHLARVKRARVGELVGVLDGRGAMGLGEIAEVTGSKQRPMVAILLDRIEMIAPVEPHIEVCSAIPKGDRLDRMIDQLTQIGVESWRPLICDRSERDPDSIRTDRIERIINESCKQCIRARSLLVQPPMTFAEALAYDDGTTIICDGSGESTITPSVDRRSRLLIGPEGGWSESEREAMHDSDAKVCRIGVHTLRLESAAVVAASIALSNAHAPIPFGDSP
jgi:16S rRNA (uracil1498-N3)-methyltransferase